MRFGDVTSTDLFVGSQLRPLQVVRVTLINDGPGMVTADGEQDGTVRIRVDGNGVATPEPVAVRGLGPGEERVVEVPVAVDAAFGEGTARPVTVRAETAAGVSHTAAEITAAATGWTMFMVSHFHYDPVWWNTQRGFTQVWYDVPAAEERRPGYVRTALDLVRIHLDAARYDPDYKFVLAEIDYLKPFWDAHPEDRADLRRFIAEGRVELLGGMYNEPSTTLTVPESTIRSTIYGMGFQRDVVGGDPRSAWMLDVFGHDPSFPGLMADAGLTATAWARGPFHQNGSSAPPLRPDLMQFPMEFEWVSPSGRGLLTSYMAKHYGPGWELERHSTLAAALDETYTQFQTLKSMAATRAVLLPVGGDHTVPSRWCTEVHRDWASRYVWPRFVVGTPREYFDAVRGHLDRGRGRLVPQSRDMNPVYTGKDVSYIDTKQAQRAAEVAVMDGERLATLATIHGARFPSEALDKAWRQLLFGAHHDGVTGVESDQVYLDLLAGWREAFELGDTVRTAALDYLATRIEFPATVPTHPNNPNRGPAASSSHAADTPTGLPISGTHPTPDPHDRAANAPTHARDATAAGTTHTDHSRSGHPPFSPEPIPDPHDRAATARTTPSLPTTVHDRGAAVGWPLLVANTLSWPRDGVTTVTLALGSQDTVGLSLQDDTGRAVPVMTEGVRRRADGTLAEVVLTFVARAVPALGYRTYRAVPDATLPDGWTAANSNPTPAAAGAGASATAPTAPAASPDSAIPAQAGIPNRTGTASDSGTPDPIVSNLLATNRTPNAPLTASGPSPAAGEPTAVPSSTAAPSPTAESGSTAGSESAAESEPVAVSEPAAASQPTPASGSAPASEPTPASGGTAASSSVAVIENTVFRVEADPGRGGSLTRIVDKRRGKELLRAGGAGNALVRYEEYSGHPRWAEGPWHVLPKGPGRSSTAIQADVRSETSPLGSRLVATWDMDDLRITQETILWDGIDRIDFRTHVDGWIGQDRLLRSRFDLDVTGALPVHEVGNAVVGRSFGYPDADTAVHPWTLDNAVHTWFGLGSTARIALLDPEPDGPAPGNPTSDSPTLSNPANSTRANAEATVARSPEAGTSNIAPRSTDSPGVDSSRVGPAATGTTTINPSPGDPAASDTTAAGTPAVALSQVGPAAADTTNADALPAGPSQPGAAAADVSAAHAATPDPSHAPATDPSPFGRAVTDRAVTDVTSAGPGSANRAAERESDRPAAPTSPEDPGFPGNSGADAGIRGADLDLTTGTDPNAGAATSASAHSSTDTERLTGTVKGRDPLTVQDATASAVSRLRMRAAIGVAEVVAPSGKTESLPESVVRDLIAKLAAQGVTATTTRPEAPRYGVLEADSNLPDVRIVLGGPDDNAFAAQVLEAADPAYSDWLGGQMAAARRGRVWVPAAAAREQTWVPSADVRGARDLPVLIVAGDDLAAAVTVLAADLADATVEVRQPAALDGHTAALEDYSASLLHRGTPGCVVTADGSLSLSLMRSCSGWPAGTWLDGPRRMVPDGSSFAWQHWSHTFEYALVADTGDWRDAGFVAAGQAYNHALLTRAVVKAPERSYQPHDHQPFRDQPGPIQGDPGPQGPDQRDPDQERSRAPHAPAPHAPVTHAPVTPQSVASGTPGSQAPHPSARRLPQSLSNLAGESNVAHEEKPHPAQPPAAETSHQEPRSGRQLHERRLPPVASLLEVEPASVVLTALKPRGNPLASSRSGHVDLRDGITVRAYESAGQSARVTLRLPAGFASGFVSAAVTNLLEEQGTERKPDARRAPAQDRGEQATQHQLTQTNADEAQVHVEAAQAHADAAPGPIGVAPGPADAAPSPAGEAPGHVSEQQDHVDAGGRGAAGARRADRSTQVDASRTERAPQTEPPECERTRPDCAVDVAEVSVQGKAVTDKTLTAIAVTGEAVTFPIRASETLTVVAVPALQPDQDQSARTDLGPTTETAQPVFSRYWLHDKGAAPIGNVPVSVHLRPTRLELPSGDAGAAAEMTARADPQEPQDTRQVTETAETDGAGTQGTGTETADMEGTGREGTDTEGTGTPADTREPQDIPQAAARTATAVAEDTTAGSGTQKPRDTLRVTVAAGAVAAAGRVELAVPPELAVAAADGFAFDLEPGEFFAADVTVAARADAPRGRYYLAARITDDLGQTLEDVCEVTVGADDAMTGMADLGDSADMADAADADDEGMQAVAAAPLSVTLESRGISLPPGGRGAVGVGIRCRARSEVRGEAQLISPFGTWRALAAWTAGFEAAPDGMTRLTFPVEVPLAARPGSRTWALVKVMAFGQVLYTEAVPVEVSA